MIRRKALSIAVVAAALVAGVAGFFALRAGGQQLRSSEREIPTARVRRGNLEMKIHTSGELRPARSAMLVAPPSRSNLQIVRLAKTGTRVNAGDVVIEFDPAEQEFRLEQARSTLLQAEQEIIKMKADAAVQAAQDKVALLQARFAVRRAELEVTRNELVSSIDGQKNNLNLEEARRRLAQLEQDVASHNASNQASLAVLEEKRNKARLETQQEEQEIRDMQVRAPITGLVAVKENQDASGGFFFSGMVLPEYREGDQVWPGRFIAEVLEVDRMEILTKVEESARASVNPGQKAEVRVDALPGQSYMGKIKTLAGSASRGRFFDSTGPVRLFDVTLDLDHPDARLRPGVTAKIVILGDQVENALLLPRQAVFEKDGKPVVYVKNGDRFDAREVQIKHRTESQVALEGINEGTEVALVNPEAPAARPGKAPPSRPVISGGGR